MFSIMNLGDLSANDFIPLMFISRRRAMNKLLSLLVLGMLELLIFAVDDRDGGRLRLFERQGAPHTLSEFDLDLSRFTSLIAVMCFDISNASSANLMFASCLIYLLRNLPSLLLSLL